MIRYNYGCETGLTKCYGSNFLVCVHVWVREYRYCFNQAAKIELQTNSFLISYHCKLNLSFHVHLQVKQMISSLAVCASLCVFILSCSDEG